MPDARLHELPETEPFAERETVGVARREGRLSASVRSAQAQRPRVSVLPEQHERHVSRGTGAADVARLHLYPVRGHWGREGELARS